MRDRLWFFATYRYQMNRQTVASMWDNKNAGDNTKWTYDPDFTKQSEDDGEWRNHSVRLTWQVTPRNKIVGWTDLHYNCLHCDAGGSSSGLTFTGLIATREALQRNENHPSSLTQIRWTSPVTNRLLLEANVQIGPNFWWGAQQKNAFDTTTIPVQDDGLTITRPRSVTFTGLNYRSANWSGHTGFTRVVQGAVSYVTGSHSAKFGARFHQNDLDVPEELLQQRSAQLQLQGRRALSADDVRRPGVGSAPAAAASSRSTRRIAGRSTGCRCRADCASSISATISPSSRSGRTASCPPPWCFRSRTARSA